MPQGNGPGPSGSEPPGGPKHQGRIAKDMQALAHRIGPGIGRNRPTVHATPQITQRTQNNLASQSGKTLGARCLSDLGLESMGGWESSITKVPRKMT